MTKIQNRDKGNMGERLAEELLVQKGYKIIERNWHNRFGEIDLIVKSGNVLVFVEVKTKVGERFGSPEEMVNARKLAQVRMAGEMYLKAIEKNTSCRIDVVAIVLDHLAQVVRINHYEGVG